MRIILGIYLLQDLLVQFPVLTAQAAGYTRRLALAAGVTPLLGSVVKAKFHHVVSCATLHSFWLCAGRVGSISRLVGVFSAVLLSSKVVEDLKTENRKRGLF